MTHSPYLTVRTQHSNAVSLLSNKVNVSPTYRNQTEGRALLLRKKKKKILHYLNTCHVNIKFTIEFEENNAIPFLDILIKRATDHTFGSRKSLNKNGRDQVLWACETEHPQQTLVFTKPLVSRTLFRSLLSPPLLVAFVVAILSWMRWKCYCQKTATPVALWTTILMMSWVGNKTNQGIQQPWYPTKEIRFVLPYLGFRSKIITKQLKACINKFYEYIDLRVIFRTYIVSSLFSPTKTGSTVLKCPKLYS